MPFSKSQVAAIATTLLVASCASNRDGDVYVFHGPDQTLDAFVAASQACGYSNIRKAVGNHVEPIVVLAVPRTTSAEYTCAWAWAKVHEIEGLTNRFPADY